MDQIKEFKRGDLVFCDIFQVASNDWELAIEGGRLLNLKNTLCTWPRALGVVLEAKPTLKVANIYIIALNRGVRSPYDYLFTVEEENEHYKT